MTNNRNEFDNNDFTPKENTRSEDFLNCFEDEIIPEQDTIVTPEETTAQELEQDTAFIQTQLQPTQETSFILVEPPAQEPMYETPPIESNTINYSTTENASFPYMSKPKTEKTRKKSKFIPFAAIVVSLSFVFSVLGTVTGNYLNGDDKSNSITNTQTEKKDTSSNTDSILKTSNKSGDPLSVEEVVKLTANSVVEITTEGMTTNERMQQYVSTGAGSGVILSNDGYIVTNNHVIADASKITVTLKDGTKYSATLIGTDPKTDIGVIKINAKDLTPATIGQSSKLNVGQQAIVIGNPLGQLGGTVTEGIISALDREITIDGETMNLLQTNAAVNPGNSGGGMFNNQGELIGVVNAKSSGSDVEGLGFAIPMDTAKSVIEDLMKYGYVQGRVNLGVTLIDIEDELTAMMYRVNKPGVYVMKTDESSNAAKAGLQPGDRITSVNKTSIETSSDIASIIDKATVGDTITMTIERNGRNGSINFVLQEDKGNNSTI